MHYIKIDGSGRLTAWAAAGFHCGEGEMAVALPEGFSPDNMADWRYAEGGLVYDPLPSAMEPVPLAQKVHELENALMELAALIGGEAA